METIEETKPSRSKILLRLLYSLICMIIFEILKLIIQVTVVFQFVYLLITQKHSEPLRSFSNKIATYAYKIIRYATLNDNTKPFPFAEFPTEMEPQAETIKYD